jgi:hypothetical protein
MRGPRDYYNTPERVPNSPVISAAVSTGTDSSCLTGVHDPIIIVILEQISVNSVVCCIVSFRSIASIDVKVRTLFYTFGIKFYSATLACYQFNNTIVMISQDITSGPKRPWTEAVAAKRAIQDAHLEKHRPSPTSTLSDLGTDTIDVQDIISLLETKKISALDLIRGFIAR